MNQELGMLRNAFRDFERDVGILERLELELKQLNRCGFEKEVHEIRVRLKDTAQIQFIRSKLKELRVKIDERKKAKKEKGGKWWKKGGKGKEGKGEKGDRGEKGGKKEEKEDGKGRWKGKCGRIFLERLSGYKERIKEGMKKLKLESKGKIEFKKYWEKKEKKNLSWGILGRKERQKKEKDDFLTKEQVEAIDDKLRESKKHRIPGFAELVWRAGHKAAKGLFAKGGFVKGEFAKPRKIIYQRDKKSIIEKLKERIQLKQGMLKKKLKEDAEKLKEYGFNVRRPMSELKIQKTIPKHHFHKQNIIQHLKDVHKRGA